MREISKREKAIVASSALAFDAAFYAGDHATNAVIEDAVGRASDRLANSI